MNRKGSLELNLETMGKLALAAVILIFIFTMAFMMIDIFNTSPESQATAAFKVLHRKLDFIAKSDFSDNYNGTVVLSIPDGYMLAGFDAGDDNIFFRPRTCNKKSACVCIAKFDGSTNPEASLNLVPIDCENIDAETISMVKSVEHKNVQKYLADSSGKFAAKATSQKEMFASYLSSSDKILPLAMSSLYRGEDLPDTKNDGSKAQFQEIQIVTKKSNDKVHYLLIWKYPSSSQLSMRDLSCTVTITDNTVKPSKSISKSGFCSKDPQCSDAKVNMGGLVNSMEFIDNVDKPSCGPIYGFDPGYKCCVPADQPSNTLKN